MTTPVFAPANEARPAARDCPTVFDRNNVMSGPGVRPRTIEANAKPARTGKSGMKSDSMDGALAVVWLLQL